jgi:polyisoprenoid-binding protein YceI
MTTTDAKCQAVFEMTSGGTPTKLYSLSCSMRAESLKSGHPAMDKNAYSTLRTTEFKTISFTFISSTLSEDKIHCVGNLNVVGVTKQISLEGFVKTMPNETLFISGSKKLLMSDFNITPPTFMFETVTTGNEITLSFNVALIPVKN